MDAYGVRLLLGSGSHTHVCNQTSHTLPPRTSHVLLLSLVLFSPLTSTLPTTLPPLHVHLLLLLSQTFPSISSSKSTPINQAHPTHQQNIFRPKSYQFFPIQIYSSKNYSNKSFNTTPSTSITHITKTHLHPQSVLWCVFLFKCFYYFKLYYEIRK